MASPNQATGRVIIKVDGEVQATMEGASLDPGGVTRTPKPLDNGDVRFTEVVREGKITFKIVDDAQAKWLDLLDLTSATLIFETDTGVSYKCAPAWCTGEAELTTESDITFNFKKAVKQ